MILLFLPFLPGVFGMGAALGALGTGLLMNVWEGHPWRIPKMGLILGIPVLLLFVLPMGIGCAWEILREPAVLVPGGVIGALLTYFTWESL